MSSKRSQANPKVRHLILLALAAVAIPLPGAAVQPIANLPAIPATMGCTLQAFQSLDLTGVADDNGQVAFTAVSLVDVSATNPAAYCSVRGVIGPGASSIVMKLPMDRLDAALRAERLRRRMRE